MTERSTYRFGPLERPSVVLGLGMAQIATLMGALVAAGVALRFWPTVLGGAGALVLVLSGALLALWPVGRRPLVDWTGVVSALGRRRLTRTHRWVSSARGRGHRLDVRRRLVALPRGALPPPLRSLEILAAGVAGERPVGIVKDRRERTYVGVLRARGRGFALLDPDEQEQAVAGWADTMAWLGRAATPIGRLQWIERTLPDDGDQARRHLAQRGEAATERLRRSYAELVEDDGGAAVEHECLLALRLDLRRAGREVRQTGRGNVDRGACEILLRHLALLADRLEGAQVEVEGALSPRLLAQAIRAGFDPAADMRRGRAGRAGAEPGLDVGRAWPQALAEDWGHLRVDGHHHRVGWVAEWPRLGAGPSFMAPLLLRGRGLRAVSLVLEPVSVLQATRAVERARVAKASDRAVGERWGRLPTIREEKQQDATEQLGLELAQGHVEARFIAYVSVAAEERADLAAACQEAEQQAAQCGLELEWLWGQQLPAFLSMLPLCRGLS